MSLFDTTYIRTYSCARKKLHSENGALFFGLEEHDWTAQSLNLVPVEHC